jgi:transcription elongation GreA/GreB family factor
VALRALRQTERMNKGQVVAQIRAELAKQLAVILEAAESARRNATHDDSRAEDKYDTRGLEASYLAGAQAGRAEELKRLQHVFDHLEVKPHPKGKPAQAGCLVTLDCDGTLGTYFLAPEGRPMTVTVGSRVVQVLTPASPLGDAVAGKKVGDFVEVEAKGGTREYEVKSIA